MDTTSHPPSEARRPPPTASPAQIRGPRSAAAPAQARAPRPPVSPAQAGAPRPPAAAFFDVEGTLLATPDLAAVTVPLGRLWHPPVLAALHGHLALGHLVVLVARASAAELAPVTRQLAPDAVLCSTPRAPMAGQGKGYAARTLLRERGITAARCYAYADEAADLPLLAEVGHRVVVGEDPVLLRHARRGNWGRLPGPYGTPGDAASGLGEPFTRG
ncbi:HAD family hydrolase [Streptomyces sp. NPDC048111]|uniref:HAD family hydrolase n=1 Tax=Streptomyces sp. NPDC048111 TaxID=3365500 RepID=UPI003715ECCA